MAQTISIPGRRVSSGETFYTDWGHRGGDCIILRVQVLIAQTTNGHSVSFALETRGEDGTAITEIDPTSPSTGLSFTAVDVGTCLYLSTSSTTLGKGVQEQVRVRVACAEEADYFVVRIFPLIFFDSARAY